MGNQNSKAGDAATSGWRILKVTSGGPCAGVGLVPYFDVLTHVNGVALGGVGGVSGQHSATRENPLVHLIRDRENQPTVLTVLNYTSKRSRQVTVTPNRNWGGGTSGLVGLVIRYDSFENADCDTFHVLDLFPGSPAEKAGLQAHTDYLLGTADITFKGNDDLDFFITKYDQVPTTIFVYNAKTCKVRETTITVNSKWGGKGALGCDVGWGLLHRLPLRDLFNKDGQIISEVTLEGAPPANATGFRAEPPLVPPISAPATATAAAAATATAAAAVDSGAAPATPTSPVGVVTEVVASTTPPLATPQPAPVPASQQPVFQPQPQSQAATATAAAAAAESIIATSYVAAPIATNPSPAASGSADGGASFFESAAPIVIPSAESQPQTATATTPVAAAVPATAAPVVAATAAVTPAPVVTAAPVTAAPAPVTAAPAAATTTPVRPAVTGFTSFSSSLPATAAGAGGVGGFRTTPFVASPFASSFTSTPFSAGNFGAIKPFTPTSFVPFTPQPFSATAGAGAAGGFTSPFVSSPFVPAAGRGTPAAATPATKPN